MGSRRQGRIIAVQTLYRHELTGQGVNELMDFSWLEDAEEEETGFDGPVGREALDFARRLIAGALEERERVDQAIRRQLQHWDFDRVARVDLAILRMSSYCLIFRPDIPASVTIDEAIDIARDYSSEDSYRFINGVLDGIRKTMERSGGSGQHAEETCGKDD